MVDPVTKADGMTYERKDIERWLSDHNTSVVTNAVLPHKNLNPNQALKSAIRDWEEEEHRKCMAHAQTVPPPVARQSTSDLEAEHERTRAELQLRKSAKAAAAAASAPAPAVQLKKSAARP